MILHSIPPPSRPPLVPFSPRSLFFPSPPDFLHPLSPFLVLTGVCVAMSQNLTVVSPDPLARCRESGLKATASTASVWPDGMGNGTAWHSMAQYGTARHGTVWHGMARHGTARYGMARHGTARYGTVWHGTARHGMARYGMAWHGTARYGTAWHGTARYGTVWHGTARYGMALHCRGTEGRDAVADHFQDGVTCRCRINPAAQPANLAIISRWLEEKRGTRVPPDDGEHFCEKGSFCLLLKPSLHDMESTLHL